MSISPGTNTQIILGLTSPESRIALPAPTSILQTNVTFEISQTNNEQTTPEISRVGAGKETGKGKLILGVEFGGKKEKVEIPITSTRLKLDEETKRIVIQILNARNEVVKQIPPEEWLKFLAKWQKIQGLFFDEIA